MQNNIHTTEWAKLLVESHLPLNQTVLLKDKYGIVLKLLFKGTSMEVDDWCRNNKYGITGNVNGHQDWYHGKVLPWGGLCGWDVTADGKFALCRVMYDDYYLYQVCDDEKMKII
jgi:hypothetical protein